jgi:sialate O-acetylesterase
VKWLVFFCAATVTIDLGESRNLHPANKQDSGRRLAQWALGSVYGKDITTSGPLSAGHEIRGSDVVLRFRHTDGGLKAKDGALKGFVIAGEDRVWKPAQTRVEGDCVIVSSPNVPLPVAARYARAADPPCILFNGAGLPASPFRTDDWPLPPR